MSLSNSGFATAGVAYGVNNDDSQQQDEIPPKKLELTLNPEDGSLQTVPLYQVLLAATDALHTDLYNMAHGEIDVYATTTTANSSAFAKPNTLKSDVDNGEDEETSDLQQQSTTTSIAPTSIQHKKERMTNLSFAQRRHELSWRISQNMKCIQQVAALSAAAACTELGNIVNVATKALKHTRTAWVQADEAQDAMYFFHAQLFPARVAPYDIYGACDVLLHGKWYDLPNDMLLNVDRYNNSTERTWSKHETDQRWQITVRDKLAMGEVGWMRRQQLLNPNFQPPLWRISLTGGIVKLTAGRPKYLSTLGSASGTTSAMKYPIEALLTVFPSKHNIWSLMSVEVNVQAKTGDFNHQLEMSNRQRFDLHRIAATAMRREEIRFNQVRAAAELSKFGSATVPVDGTEVGDDSMDHQETIPATSRPLQALFRVAHMFLMAWQLELISAQALALRRGVWGATDGTSLSVTPVRFFDNSDGYMSISFWKVDDAYGPPSMGDLNRNNNSDNATTDDAKPDFLLNGGMPLSTGQLTLKIRAESSSGIIVSLSGGRAISAASVNERPMIKSTINELIEAATNPMALSASDALLAATKLCAEFKCLAVVEALQPKTDDPLLPSWLCISVRRGCIVVAVNLKYHGRQMDSALSLSSSRKCVIFQIVCDARTGSFVIAVPQSMKLLQQLVCDDIHASAPVALRIASLPLNRRRAAGSNSTGRIVREAFDSLIRSMNLLGQRVGVGGLWDDIDDKSYLLRQRAVHSACVDVKTALIPCCGLASLFGIVPLALGTALGLVAVPDIAGSPIESLDGYAFVKAPPISIMLSQDMVETIVHKSEGVATKKHHLEQSLLSFTCSANDNSLCIFPISINVKLESPSGFVERLSCSLLSFKELIVENLKTSGESSEEPRKRLKQTLCIDEQELEEATFEVEVMSELIATLIEE